jgi:hypothetical protein
MTEQNLVKKLFEMCIPNTQSQSNEHIPILCMLILKDMFTYGELKIEKII